jgi:hypothetical protein
MGACTVAAPERVGGGGGSFCSVFPDTDAAFGSQGDFFTCCRRWSGSIGGTGGTGGIGSSGSSRGGLDSLFDEAELAGLSLQCNPPFDAWTLHQVACTVEDLLQRASSSQAPVSIVCTVPAWPGWPLDRLAQSPFCRHCIVLAKEDHAYITGSQHHASVKAKHRRVMFECASWLLFLQNDAAAALWPASEVQVEKLRAGWMPQQCAKSRQTKGGK